MSKARKWARAGLVATGVMAAAAAGASWWLAQVDIPKVAKEKAREALGVELEIGQVGWRFFPSPGAIFSDVSVGVGAAGESGKREIARAGKAMAFLSWSGLWRGELLIDSVEIEEVKVWARLGSQGDPSWGGMLSKARQGRGQNGGANGGVNVLEKIKSASVKGVDLEVSMNGAEAKSWRVEEFSGWKEAQGWGWRSRSSVDGSEASASGLAEVRADGSAAGRIEASWAGARLSGYGEALSPESMWFAWEAKVEDMSKIGRAVGWGGASGSAEGKGKVELAGGQWRMAVESAKAAGWAGQGKLGLRIQSGRPEVAFEVALTGPGGASSGRGRAEARPEKMERELPWAALSLADAKGAISATGLPWGGVSQASGRVDLRAGVLRIEDASARFEGGVVKGRVEADAGKRELAVEATLEGVTIESLMARAGANSMVKGGPLAASARLRMSGSRLSELSKSVSGELAGRAGAASWSFGGGGALGELVPWAKKAGGALALDCIGFRARLEAGVARGAPMVGAEGPLASLSGSGVLDLGIGELDLGIEVRPKGFLDLSSIGKLASSGRVSGPLSGPRWSVDAGKAGAGLAELGAALSQGGGALVAEALGRKEAARPSACAVALGESAPAASENARAPEPAAAPSEEKKPGWRGAKQLEKLRGLLGR